MNATSNTATSIIVCFEFPEGSTQNGEITSFNVTLVGTPFDTDSRNVSIPVTSTDYPLTGSVCGDVTNLEEYNNYTITVLVTNSAGSGPSSSSVEIRTQQAGMIMCLYSVEYVITIFKINLYLINYVIRSYVLRLLNLQT